MMASNESAEHSTSLIKVHGLMCLELQKFIDRISKIHSEAESPPPRCTGGVQTLCSLLETIDKARLLIQHCSEASKLYLAMTAERISIRCRKIQDSLDVNLGRIQNLVSPLLAAKISGVIQDLRGAKFLLKSSEEKAGMVLLELIKQGIPPTDSFNNSEFEAIQSAAVELKITSPPAVLVERRSVKSLYDKVFHPEKRIMLNNLYYLLIKYGELIGRRNLSQHHQELNSIAWDEKEVDESASPEPPQDFKCPVSMRSCYNCFRENI